MTVLARPHAAIVAGAAGCSLLVARPLLLRNGSHPTATLAMLFVALLVAGLAWPRHRTSPSKTSPSLSARPTSGHERLEPTDLERFGGRSVAALPVLLVGIGAFLVGRVLGGGHAPQPLVLRVVALGSLAAVAEEVFFRHFVYDSLRPGGELVAVAGSAVLFALVHVTVYGWWVLPIDLAAGFVLSWQRWATGSWKVPAVTHVLANLLVVL
ncbi:MAG: CPBP family intramembrane metalloprotease [Acidimicrobiia bacterium]|nr:CPBP family intramembrane metalloprotease [Acidimicrobiia bacterium]